MTQYITFRIIVKPLSKIKPNVETMKSYFSSKMVLPFIIGDVGSVAFFDGLIRTQKPMI